MTIQVVYKNKAKSGNQDVIAVFANEKFQIKNTSDFFSKNETSSLERILKNKKNTKENIISFNINEKTTVILISLKKDLKSFDVENLGAVFYNFIKKNLFKNLSIITGSIKSKPGKDFIGRFVHGIKLKSYEFNIYKSKKTKNIIKNIKNHISRGGALLGVCNGFQILIEANILPGSLVRNKKLLFTCRETTLEVQDSIQSPFLSSFNTGDCLNIPVAHNEGNYIANNELLKELENNGRIAFKYKKSSEIETDYNPNGSLNDIAGILSKNGRVLGMMPHPERSINSLHGGTDGLKFLTKSIEQIVG